MPRARNKSKVAAARARMYRDLVFECAERVFAEEGFNESTMQDLAAEAGISLKTLYATFPGKDDIYREILAERGAGLLEAIASVHRASGSALERLGVGVRGIVAYLVENPRFFRIILQEGRAWGLDPRGQAARESWKAGLAAVRGVLVQGIESGEFLPADPDLLAPTVIAILQVQLAGLLERDRASSADAIADEILGSLCRLLCGEPSVERGADRAQG
ncbi:MAG: TetR/AcrR family transcriptional regulator [Myxococcota bacterium]|nr:TetR/AcrR family transcriptional regulator [Myxococcota bacterium]